MNFLPSQKNLTQQQEVVYDYVSPEEVQEFDLHNQLVTLAVPLAQTWRENHPEAQPASEADLESCVLAVAIEMAVAGDAVGGPTGALIAAGGGISAAEVACRRVL